MAERAVGALTDLRGAHHPCRIHQTTDGLNRSSRATKSPSETRQKDISPKAEASSSRARPMLSMTPPTPPILPAPTGTPVADRTVRERRHERRVRTHERAAPPSREREGAATTALH